TTLLAFSSLPRSLRLPHSLSSVFSYSFALFCALLRSFALFCKTQLFSFQSFPHSLHKTKSRIEGKKSWRDELASTNSRKRLLPWRVQSERQDPCVSLEIQAAGKNGPIAGEGDDAN